MGVNDDRDREDDDNDTDDDVNVWANGDFSTFSDFNLVWYLHTSLSLRFGITPVTHQQTLRDVDNVEIKIVHPTDDRLAEIADLPLVVDKGQRGMK